MVFESFIFLGIISFLTTFEMALETYLRITVSLIVSGFAAMAYGFSISGIFESVWLTLELGPPLDLLLLILGGAFINVNTISLPAMKYVSVFFYANEAISYDYWRNVESIGK